MPFADNVRIVMSFIILSLAGSLFILLSRIVNADSFWAPAVISTLVNLCVSTIVAIILTLSDRKSVLTSVLTPLIAKSEDLHRDIKVNLFTLANLAPSIEHATAQLGPSIDAVTEKMFDFDNYTKARNIYGLNRVDGPKPIYMTATDSKFEGYYDLIDEIISGSVSGDRIDHMISFIEHYTALQPKIEQAVNRGVHIRFLVMMAQESEAVKSRFVDIKNVRRWNSINTLIEILKPNVRALKETELAIETSNRSLLHASGSFQIRFFTQSLNIPMIIFYSAKPYSVPAIYTGFYTLENVEEMPYVVWRGGAFGIARQFISLFETKWKDCINNTDPFVGYTN